MLKLARQYSRASKAGTQPGIIPILMKCFVCTLDVFVGNESIYLTLQRLCHTRVLECCKMNIL